VLRKFDEMLRIENIEELDTPRTPYIFSAFLQSKNITLGKSLVFSIDLAVSTTEYEIDNFLFLKTTIPGEYLFRNTIVVRVKSETDGFKVRYLFSDDSWGESNGVAIKQDDKGMYIPLASNKGFKAKLRLKINRWNEAPG